MLRAVCMLLVERCMGNVVEQPRVQLGSLVCLAVRWVYSLFK